MSKWAFDICLICDPPTITHQAKKIGYFRRRTAQGAKMTPRLIDDPKLAGAIRTYLVLLRASGKVPHRPLSGYVELELAFRWANGKSQTDEEWRPLTPDWDNAAKTLQDCLVQAGFIERDEQVVRCTVVKLRGPGACVQIRGRELPPYEKWLEEEP